MVRQATSDFGKLDLFVNNAAAAWHQSITHVTTDSWRRTLDTNLSACVWACRLSSYITGAELVVDGGLHLRPLPLYSDGEIARLNLEERA